MAAWARSALPLARSAARDPAYAEKLMCGGTWFCGTNALTNSRTGRIPGGPALAGAAIDFVITELSHAPDQWDAAQVSICYPGYPRSMPGEAPAAFRFRQRRDAAHVDGLLAEGPGRRRHLREGHAFLLGIPLGRTAPDASPFVVYEGSHEIMRAMFRASLASLEPAAWADVDLTNAYMAARKKVFETCRRVEVPVQPGEAFVVHRLAVHGMAPWSPDAQPASDGRIMAYFRPAMALSSAWLVDP